MGIDRGGLKGGAPRSYLYKRVSTTKGDVSCDVMSRMSDAHLRKLATYVHAVKFFARYIFVCRPSNFNV